MLCQRRNREYGSYGKKNYRQPRSSGTPQFPVEHLGWPSPVLAILRQVLRDSRAVSRKKGLIWELRPDEERGHGRTGRTGSLPYGPDKASSGSQASLRNREAHSLTL
jgi:hypothetical protein